MSLFVTNSATRRGKKARTEFYSYDNARSTRVVPGKDTAIHSGVREVHSHGHELSYTTIGGNTSKGLTVVGGLRTRDRRRGVNPDDRDDVILGKSGEEGGLVDGYPNEFAAEPIYPITFSGPGHMRFDSAIGIPNIRGNTHIAGELSVNGDTRCNNLIVGGDITDPDGNPLVTPFVQNFSPTMEDELGRTATLTIADGVSSLQGSIVQFAMDVEWSSLGTMDGEIRFGGFPYSSGRDSVFSLRRQRGLHVNTIGSSMTIVYPENQTYVGVYENYTTTGEPESAITTANADSTGRVFIVGFGLI